MGWTLAIAIAAMALTFAHLLFIRIPEGAPEPDPNASSALDFRGSVRAIRLAPGLFALIIFSTFNNLIGGVYMALMDPYGLTLFDAQTWGFALAFASTGFLVGGGLVAKFGLGPKPMRTMLLVVIAMGLLGSVFMLREWWPLYVIGMWAYMALVPPVEAAEQTIIQKVVPYERQGRVFGVAAAMEAAAGPDHRVPDRPDRRVPDHPYMNTREGQQSWGWLLGEGEARGIALICLFAGLIMVVAATLAFFTRSYRKLTELYAAAPEQEIDHGEDGDASRGPRRARKRSGRASVGMPRPRPSCREYRPSPAERRGSVEVEHPVVEGGGVRVPEHEEPCGQDLGIERLGAEHDGCGAQLLTGIARGLRVPLRTARVQASLAAFTAA